MEKEASLLLNYQLINHANHLIQRIMVQTSYDIVKAHRGELKVETKVGVGTEFIIQIPLKTSI
jgi:signal transduction histidine kinase